MNKDQYSLATLAGMNQAKELLFSAMNQYQDQITKLIKVDEKIKLLETAGIKCYLPYYSAKVRVDIVNDTPQTEREFFVSTCKRLVTLLGEAPEIHMTEYYLEAEFKESGVEYLITKPSDCKMIEEEITETRIKRTPHPACIAALRTLEDLDIPPKSELG